MSPLDLDFFTKRRLPIIHSAEAAECGLACVAMVARFHGHDVDLNGLRQRFPLSLSGVHLRALMELADKLGLSARALRLELDQLGKLRLPAILHWDMNHFVVLKEATAKGGVVHDPAFGVRALSTKELSKHFTGVALELSPAASFAPMSARKPVNIAQLWSRMTGFLSALAQVFVLSLALQIATFAAPFQLQLVIDQAIDNADANLLNVLALGFGALVLIQVAVQGLRDWDLQIFGNLLGFQVVGNLVRHLLRLPADFFEKRHIGDVLSRIRSSEPIRNALTQGVIGAIIDGGMALVAAIILFLYSPLLACVVILALALSLGVVMATYPAIRARTAEQIVASAKEQSLLMENVRAAVTIKLMGREVERENTWRNAYAPVVNTGLALGKFQIVNAGMQAAIAGIQTVLVIYLGARMILGGDGFSVGMLIAFLSFRQTFSDRVISLVNQAIQFRLLGLHLERLGDIVHAAPEAQGIAPLAASAEGGIRMKGVSFRYGAADPYVLQDIDLDIRPGALAVITGPSGGGKTTLLKLLTGLRQPSSGEIWLDGRAATPEAWRAWRAQVGIVMQDDHLLSGTIADNIAFFDPFFSMERVQEAAMAAQIHQDILRLPMQYLSLVGDMGSVLSGGQRQRILLARALYRKPRILILDEGTANLDRRNEAAIFELISRLKITRIIITHQPAVANADCFYVVDGGRLTEALPQQRLAFA
jgi:ATP-binding cassette subfamily B protein RaxB